MGLIKLVARQRYMTIIFGSLIAAALIVSVGLALLQQTALIPLFIAILLIIHLTITLIVMRFNQQLSQLSNQYAEKLNQQAQEFNSRLNQQVQALHASQKDREKLNAELQQTRTQLQQGVQELHEARGQLSQQLKSELKVLREEFASNLDKRQQTLTSKISLVEHAVRDERSGRIAAFARLRDGDKLPERVLTLLTVPRSGSTWLMDMLRSNPYITLRPSARIFELLQLEGGRYPLGLSNGPNARTDFENMPDRGTRIPAFTPLGHPMPIAAQRPYALEKIHPQFFQDDAEAFNQTVCEVEQEHGIHFHFVYQVRDPRSTISSFLNYQKRDPSWLRYINMDEVLPYHLRAYRTMLDFARLRSGFLVDYPPLKTNPTGMLTTLYQELWPDEDPELLREHASAAVAATRREKRQSEHTDKFLGATEGAISGGSAEYAELFEANTDLMDQIYSDYHALLAMYEPSGSDSNDGDSM